MKHPQLQAEPRTVLGKQVKKLRREGLLPANIYGKELASTAVQVKYTDFDPLYKEVGETGLIDVMLDGTRRPVLIKNVNWDFRTHTALHADFYQVNLKEKVKAMIPLVIVGEPTAVTEKLGTLLTQMSEIEVEALPEALPENFEVNVETLAAVDDQITVADLQTGEGVTILTDAAQIVAKIGELAVEEPEPAPEEAAEGTEGAEGEAATEGEGTPSEEKTEDGETSQES